MAEEIVNRVAKSPLQTIDLEELPHSGERVVLDIKDWLFQGMILKEKDFRKEVKAHDWEQYQDQNVAITCSAEAIVPTWAYMLIATKLQGIANRYVFGNLDELKEILYLDAIHAMDPADYQGGKFVVKGCGGVPTKIYIELTRKLLPEASSIMYGEPCSSVPVYKKPRKK